MSNESDQIKDPRFNGQRTEISSVSKAQLLDPNQTVGYEVYITEHARLTWGYLASDQAEMAVLRRAMMELSALPRKLDSFQRIDGVDVFKCHIGLRGEYQIEYSIYSGAVTIYSFSLAGKALKIQQKSEKPQLYHLKKKNDAWAIDVRNPPKTTILKTTHAAVNGQSNDLQKAAWLMGTHLESRYGAISEYTLFHNPTDYMFGGAGDTWESVRDKIGMTTPVTKEFVKILGDVQNQKTPVKWVAHSQGAAIFAEGVRVYEKQVKNKSSTDKILDMHSVVFNSGAINIGYNKPRLNRVGISFSTYNAPNDLVPQIAGMNAVTLLVKGARARKVGLEKIKRSIRDRKDIFEGTTTESSHTLPYHGSRDRANKMKHGLQTPSEEMLALHEAAINGMDGASNDGVARKFYSFMSKRRG